MAPEEVIITGNQKDEAFRQLKMSVSGQLDIFMDANGKLHLNSIINSPLTKGASDLLSAIIDQSITVNLSATDNDFISDGSAPLLGAFMGNEIKSNGNIDAFQEINPIALGMMDEINGKHGQSTLHEVTESYVGGKLSQINGISVGKASLEDANNPNSIYRQAHDSVVPQSGNVFEHFYNSQGQEVFRNTPNFNPVKLQYSTGDGRVFHTIPKR